MSPRVVDAAWFWIAGATSSLLPVDFLSLIHISETAGQVSENWEQLKLKEKDGNKTVLSGVPAALPSLIKAYRIQDKARNVGFDWEEREQVWDKVKE